MVLRRPIPLLTVCLLLSALSGVRATGAGHPETAQTPSDFLDWRVAALPATPRLAQEVQLRGKTLYVVSATTSDPAVEGLYLVNRDGDPLAFMPTAGDDCAPQDLVIATPLALLPVTDSAPDTPLLAHVVRDRAPTELRKECGVARLDVETEYCSSPPPLCTIPDWYLVGLDSQGSKLWRVSEPEPIVAHVSATDSLGRWRGYALLDDGTVHSYDCEGNRIGEVLLSQWFDLPRGWIAGDMTRAADSTRVWLTLVAEQGPYQPVRLMGFELGATDLGSRFLPDSLRVLFDHPFDGIGSEPLDDRQIEGFWITGDTLRVRTATRVQSSTDPSDAYWTDRADYRLLIPTGEILQPVWFVEAQLDSVAPSSTPLLRLVDSRGGSHQIPVPDSMVDFGVSPSVRAVAPLWVLTKEDTTTGEWPRFIRYSLSGDIHSSVDLVHPQAASSDPYVLRSFERGNGRILYNGLTDSGFGTNPFHYHLGALTRNERTGWGAAFLMDLYEVEIRRRFRPLSPIVQAVLPDTYLVEQEPDSSKLIYIYRQGLPEGLIVDLSPGPCSVFETNYVDLRVVDDGESLEVVGESGHRYRFGRLGDVRIVSPFSPRIDGTVVEFNSLDGSLDFGLPVLDVRSVQPEIAFALLDAGDHFELATVKTLRPLEEIGTRRVLAPKDSLDVDRLVAHAFCHQVVLSGSDYAVAWTALDRETLPLFIHRGAGADVAHSGWLRVAGETQRLLYVAARDTARAAADLVQLRREVVLSPSGQPEADWRVVFDGHDPYISPEIRLQRVYSVPSRITTPVVVEGASGLLQYLSVYGRACIPGDLNRQGELDAGDAVLALRALVGLDTLTDVEDRCAADFDQDGAADLGDVIRLLQAITGPDSTRLRVAERAAGEPPRWRLDSATGQLRVDLPTPVLGLAVTLADSGLALDFLYEEGVQVSHQGRGAWASARAQTGEARIRLSGSRSAHALRLIEAEAILLDGRHLRWPEQALTGELPPAIPTRTALLDPRPNPFNPNTTVVFELAHQQSIDLSVLDARGRHIADLASGIWEAGRHELLWDGRDRHGRLVASGAYRLRLRTEDGVRSRGILLLK